jgi:hypothetical protein
MVMHVLVQFVAAYKAYMSALFTLVGQGTDVSHQSCQQLNF